MNHWRMLAIGVVAVQVVSASSQWWMAYALGPVVAERLAAGCFEWCGLDRFVHQVAGGATLLVAVAWSPWIIRAPSHRALAWIDGIGSVVGMLVLAVLATTVGAVAAWALAGVAAAATLTRGLWVIGAKPCAPAAKPS